MIATGNVLEASIGGGLLLEDNPFMDGLTFRVSIEVSPEFQLIGKVFAELRTVSEEYYLFHTSVTRSQGQEDGPFTEPVTIFNNVTNGHGIFAGYNASRDSTSLEI